MRDNTAISQETMERGQLRIELVQSLEGLAAHVDAWDRLALEAPQNLPAISSAWVTAFYEHQLQKSESWCCFFVYDRKDLVGVLPIVITPNRLLGLKRPRLRTPQNNHVYSVDFVVAGGRESEIIPYLLSAVDRVEPSRFCLGLIRLPDTSPTLSVLESGVAGMSVVREYDGKGSYVSVIGNYGEYRSRLSINFRNNLRKMKNKISRLPNVKTVFLSGTEATEKDLQHFLEVEASGWKGRGGSAILMSPSLSAFYRSIVRRLARLGWLEWHFLQTEEKIIAAQLAVKMGRTLTVVKIGYDEEYAWCSPGNYLFERTVERAFESGDTDDINCLTDMPWHRKWKMKQRDYYNLWIYPRRPIPLLFGAGGRKIKNALRRTPGLLPLYHGLRGLAKGERS